MSLESQESLLEKLEIVIQQHLQEWDTSVFDLVGVLDTLKTGLALGIYTEEKGAEDDAG